MKSGAFERLMTIVLAMLCSLITACLVPGAPHHFQYKSRSTNAIVKVTSFPNAIDFELLPVVDGVFIFDGHAGMFKKMNYQENFKSLTYRRKEKLINGNLRRMMKTDTIFLKSCQAEKSIIDTLYKYHP